VVKWTTIRTFETRFIKTVKGWAYIEYSKNYSKDESCETYLVYGNWVLDEETNHSVEVEIEAKRCIEKSLLHKREEYTVKGRIKQNRVHASEEYNIGTTTTYSAYNERAKKVFEELREVFNRLPKGLPESSGKTAGGNGSG